MVDHSLNVPEFESHAVYPPQLVLVRQVLPPPSLNMF